MQKKINLFHPLIFLSCINDSTDASKLIMNNGHKYFKEINATCLQHINNILKIHQLKISFLGPVIHMLSRKKKLGFSEQFEILPNCTQRQNMSVVIELNVL